MRLLFLTVILLFSCHLTAGKIKSKTWWKNAVLYQVYPRSFRDSDGDGIGDLQGVIEKLDHFVESGVNAIWLSSIYASPNFDFGYDISDYRDVQPDYGTLDDLEELTSKAKKLGIKVIMDFVPNHTSNRHYWFQQSIRGIGKYKDYYIWRQGTNDNDSPPNNWLSQYGGSAWTYLPARDSWYYHGFGWFQPELNFTNPEVREEMEDILSFWLSKGIDGFHIDSTAYMYEVDTLPNEPQVPGTTLSANNYYSLQHIYTMNDPRSFELVESWRKLVDEYANIHDEDEKVILTEVYTNFENATKYYKYGAQVPFNLNFITNLTQSSKPSHYRDIINDWIRNVPRDGVANWVIGNHDNKRVATRFPGRADQMTMLQMILPGIAVTYNGDEIAMTDKDDITWEQTVDPIACSTDAQTYQTKTRDPERTPFQWDDSQNAGFSNASATWLPVNSNYQTLNLAKQKQDSQSHFKLYQTLAKLKKTSKTLQKGRVIAQQSKDDTVLAVMLQRPGETIVELVNFLDDKAQQINIRTVPKKLKAKVIVSSVGSNIEWGSTMETSNVNLPAKASVVLQFKTRNVKSIT